FIRSCFLSQDELLPFPTRPSSELQKNRVCASAALQAACARLAYPIPNDVLPILRIPSTQPTPLTNCALQHCWRHFGNESTVAACCAPNTAPSLPSAWMTSPKYRAATATRSSSASPMAPP